MPKEFFQPVVYDITGKIEMPNLILLYYYSSVGEKRLLQVICTPEACFVAARELALYMTDSEELSIQFCMDNGYPAENRKRDFCVTRIDELTEKINQWHRRHRGGVLPKRYNTNDVEKYARRNLVSYCANKQLSAYKHYMKSWGEDFDESHMVRRSKRTK